MTAEVLSSVVAYCLAPFAAVTLVAAGFAARMHPPLIPLGDLSILGRRFVWAVGATAGAVVILVSATIEQYLGAVSVTAEAAALPQALVTLAFWFGGAFGTILLGTDMIRLGRRRRSNCLDAALHRLPVPPGRARRALRWVLRTSIASSVWIVIATYVVLPLLALELVWVLLFGRLYTVP